MKALYYRLGKYEMDSVYAEVDNFFDVTLQGASGPTDRMVFSEAEQILKAIPIQPKVKITEPDLCEPLVSCKSSPRKVIL